MAIVIVAARQHAGLAVVLDAREERGDGRLVAALARDIRNGQRMFNAQPICFSRSGRLLNGQHRLSAVIEASDGLSYWALRHPADKPDFHDADGFALLLEPPGPKC